MDAAAEGNQDAFTAGRLLAYDELLNITRNALWADDEKPCEFELEEVLYEKSEGALKPSPASPI